MELFFALILWCFHICIASSGIKTGKAADFYVPDLPGLAPGTKVPEMHAGLLEVGSKVGLPPTSLFFWHIRALQDTQTTVIWLNGGPGCSSMDGNLLEIGPFRLGNPENNEDGKLLYNSKGTWAEVANLLFVDQPFGTGYSDPADHVELKSLEEIAKAFIVFLKEYVKVFPEIAQTNIVLAGESFAGQYLPHIFHALLEDSDSWDLIGGIQSVLLGNPWIDPPNQYLSVTPYVRKHDLLAKEHMKELEYLEQVCLQDLNQYMEGHDKMMFKMDSCDSMTAYTPTKSMKNGKCMNVYNIGLISPAPTCGMEWPDGVDRLTSWLSRDDVRDALHAPAKSNGREMWTECSNPVGNRLVHGVASNYYVPEILERVPMMLLIGDNDFVCNEIGLDRFVKNMEWDGQAGFGDDIDLVETEYGTFRSGRNLTVVHVANASHMVPVDNLELSRDLLVDFASIHSDLNSSTWGSSGSGSSHTNDGSDSTPSSSEEEINNAMYRAYGQASVVALIVVLVVCAILGIIWWRRGQDVSGTGCLNGFLNALLHSSVRITPQRDQTDYVPLQNMKRTPRSLRTNVIIEEDEEGLE